MRNSEINNNFDLGEDFMGRFSFGKLPGNNVVCDSSEGHKKGNTIEEGKFWFFTKSQQFLTVHYGVR